MQTSSQYPRFVTPVRLGPWHRAGHQGTTKQKRTRVEFDDQRFVDVGSEFVAVRGLLEDAFGLVGIHFDPGGHAHLGGQLQGLDHAGLLLGLLANGDHVAGLDQVRRDVDRLAVHRDGLVRHQLARFGAGGAEAHAVDHVVQARLEQEQQVGAGVATAAIGLFEVAAELLLEHAVHALDLLLLAQLQAEVGGALARGAAVLAGLGVELGLVLDRAAGALQEQVGAFTAGEFGLGAEVTCHEIFLCVICREGPSFAGAARPLGRRRWACF